MMENLLIALGRFHPLIVHLPIGFLLLGFFFECISLLRRYRRLETAVSSTMFVGAIAALFASISGWLLKGEGGYDEVIVTRHFYLGMSTTVLAFILVVVRSRIRRVVVKPISRRRINLALSSVLVVLLSATGHFGGSLTHGDDYLTAAFAPQNDIDPLISIRKISNVDSAELYEQIVKPLLSARCYSCHSSASQKGKLRLDSEEFMRKGGKHGSALADGVPDSSLLYKLLTLPIDDDHHMPPREKTQMSSTEIDLIGQWLENGAPFGGKIAELQNADKIVELVHSMQYQSEKPWIPEEDISPGDPEIIAQLQRKGVIVNQVSSASNYLLINYINCDSVRETFALLRKLQPQIVWLQLGGKKLSMEDTKVISELKNLRALYLNDTQVTDEAMASLVSLENLIYLNLVNTKITDASFMHFARMKSLRRLYLFGTAISDGNLDKYLMEVKDVTVDIGSYSLPAIPSDTITYRRRV